MGQSWAYDRRRERPSYPWRGRAGCCGDCGAPPERCQCHECRREARSLLVEDTGRDGAKAASAGALTDVVKDEAAPADSVNPVVFSTGSTGEGYIGGDCCVSLSVEVAANTPTTAFNARVLVRDTEGDTLTWAKVEPAGTRYKVHEHVITTRPGARLAVEASNCTVRVRWCECFSC